MKTPFLDYWTKRKEREEKLEKRQRIKLTTAQLSTLVGDSDVRAALQSSRVASLLPPVGTEVFRRFTPTSLVQIQKSKNKMIEEDYGLKPAPELESEKTLPFFYGVPPPELRNVPLEDPDPFYQAQKTFVVVDSANTLSRFNAGSSCFHFSPFSLLRRAAIKILNHKLFTALICVVLLVNFFFIELEYDLDRPWEYILEWVFLSVYTVEAVLKVLSRGFCMGRFTYLRDSWNRMDFVIITTGFAFFGIRQLWFFKALRFIKLLGLFPATRRNAKLFGRALNQLWDVLLLTLLVLSVFSIIGMSLLSGSLRNKCVMWPLDSSNSSNLSISMDSLNSTEGPEFDYLTYINDPSHHYYVKDKKDPMICGNLSTSSSCPKGYMCLQTKTNPEFGYTNYDHFGYAFLATFRLMTRDFWEALAQVAMQAKGTFIMIHFVVVLFICSFSLTAFIVAAFTITFTEQTQREVKEAEQDQRDYEKILAALKDKVEVELQKNPDPKLSCWRRMCSCDCCDCWVRLKKGLQVVVLDPFFDMTIIILIILNICFFSTEHYPITENFQNTLSLSEFVFTCIFFLEVVVKILALGPYEFFKVKWHYFDTAIAVLSILEFGLADIGGLTEVAKVFRLFRLGRWWPGFLKWMRLAWAGLCSLWTLSLVLVSLFFTMLGMFMFWEGFEENVCRISEDCLLPRWHWSNFFHSFMIVTRALCGEWIETLWLCLEASNQFVCVVFYVMLLIVGNFLILTLVLTLLMKWISDKLAPKDEEKMQTFKIRIIKMLQVCGIKSEGKTKEAAVEDTDDVGLSCVTTEHTEENGTERSTLPIGEAQNFQKMKETEDATGDPDDCCCPECYSCCPSLDKTQGCGRVWANLRRASFNIIQHPFFDNFIFFIILVSCVSMVFEDTYLLIYLALLDQVIAYLFVLEVLFKWIGLGFYRYFRNGWCWLDFVVILACVVSASVQFTSLDSPLVSLMALRPLRILAHIKGTRRAVGSLLKLVPSLLNVLLVSLTVWLFFANMFIIFYAGKFFFCFNETSNEMFDYESVANKTQCFMLIEQNFTEVHWKNMYFNFDNAPQAYLSLFSLATFKGWVDILFSATDSTKVEDQPQFETFVYHYVFFLCFFLFGCFFCLIHILKVLFDTYSSQTQKMGGAHLFLTEKQMKNFSDISFCSKRPLAPCPRPQGRLRGRLYDLVSRERFEWVMQAVILLGVVLLMIDRYDMTDHEFVVHNWLFFVMIVLFLLECIMKICAFRRSYFSDNLNTIDFVVLILQILSMCVLDLLTKYLISPACLHLLRLGRLSRIIHRFPGALRLRLLFAAWTKSLRAVFNLALLLFILMFIYAKFGWFHFHQLQKSAALTDMTNFETLGNSLVSMWTVVTWGGWEGLLLPALYTQPDCELARSPGSNGTCGNPALGVAFFVSFLCLSSFVVLVMLLVVLVDMLNMFAEMHCDPLSVLNLNHFYKAWRKFAPDSSLYIQHSQLPDLCDKLKKPLRIPKPSKLNLELSPGEQVHCRDVLLALSVKALGDCADRDALRARIDEKCHGFLSNNPSQESCEMTSCALQMNQEEAATPVTEGIEE